MYLFISADVAVAIWKKGGKRYKEILGKREAFLTLGKDFDNGERKETMQHSKGIHTHLTSKDKRAVGLALALLVPPQKKKREREETLAIHPSLRLRKY